MRCRHTACTQHAHACADIEDITAKTGNYKRFPVFIKMLLSALKQASDSVFVDLLTYADLEALKARKAAAATGAAATKPTANPLLPPNNKRYLILTYAAEFDRVHYPLPLLFEDHPDPHHLRSVIASLRAELDAARGNGGGGGSQLAWGTAPSSGGVGDGSEMRRLRDENAALRREVQEILVARRVGGGPGSVVSAAPSSAAGIAGAGAGGGGEARELARELRAVRKERDALAARLAEVEAEAERERGLHRRELRRKAKENQEVWRDGHHGMIVLVCVSCDVM